MGQRQDIEKLSRDVFAGLKLYVEVHDGIFAQPLWRSIPLPGLFKPIPFDKYETQISGVEQVLKERVAHARSLYEKAAPDEKAYSALLHRYAAALLKAVMALRPIVAGLKGKTERKPYDMSAYNAHLAAYRNSEKGYQALGKEMNREWRAFRAARS
jgi:hypothetical protein